jgi:hypothetical protein
LLVDKGLFAFTSKVSNRITMVRFPTFFAVSVNWLILLLAPPAVVKGQAEDLTSCPTDIGTLYSENSTTSAALITYLSNFSDFCSLDTSSEVCSFELPSVDPSAGLSNILASVMQGLNVEGKFNFTAYSANNMALHHALMDACPSEDGAKFCHLGAHIQASGVFFLVPFSLHQVVIDMPICIPQSCSETDLVGFSNQMSPNVTSDFSMIPGVTIDTLNVTDVTISMCE